METITSQDAQQQLPSLIDSATNDLKRFRITGSEGAVILLPEETYDNLMITLELLSNPSLMNSIRQSNCSESPEEYCSYSETTECQ